MIVEEKLEQTQKSFVLPRITKLANLNNWPSAVACTAQINELIPELCRLPYDYLYRDDPEAFAECSLLVWEYTGVDKLSSNLDIYNFEAESAGAGLVFSPDCMPAIDHTNRLVKDSSDLSKVRFNGLGSGRLAYLLRYYRAWQALSGINTYPTFCAPFSLACSLFGLDNLLVAALDDPDFVQSLLARCVDDLLGPYVAAVCSELPGMPSISCADAWFSLPLINLDMMEQYESFLYRLRFAASSDLPVTSGAIWGFSYLRGLDLDRLTDLLLRVSGSLTVLDPDVANIGPEYFRGAADRRGVALTLGLSSNLMLTGSVAEVVSRVRRYVLVGKDGHTPFTLFLNNLAPRTPLENIFAAVTAVATYGAVGATAETAFDMPTIEPFEKFLVRKMADSSVGYSFDWLSRSGYSYLL